MHEHPWEHGPRVDRPPDVLDVALRADAPPPKRAEVGPMSQVEDHYAFEALEIPVPVEARACARARVSARWGWGGGRPQERPLPTPRQPLRASHFGKREQQS